MKQKIIILRLRISGASGILTPIIAFLFISLAIYSAPEFSWTENALSDLGVIAGATAPLFNYGLIVSGLLGFIFSISLVRMMRFFNILSAHGKPHMIIYRGVGGSLLFSLACLALMAIGVFPESVSYAHFLASVAFFVLMLGALLLFGIGFLKLRQKPLAAFTLLLGAVGTVPWLLHFVIRYIPGVAIPELISAVAGGAWTAFFSYKMLKMASTKKGI